jgi:prevent-host-death family protein
MSSRANLNLDVDLQRGVVPISKAASSLAALIKRASTTGRPVIVTQKGYPTGVLLPVELFATLKSLAAEQGEAGGTPTPKAIEEVISSLNGSDATLEAEAEVEAPAPKARRSSPRRRKQAEADSTEGES